MGLHHGQQHKGAVLIGIVSIFDWYCPLARGGAGSRVDIVSLSLKTRITVGSVPTCAETTIEDNPSNDKFLNRIKQTHAPYPLSCARNASGCPL